MPIKNPENRKQYQKNWNKNYPNYQSDYYKEHKNETKEQRNISSKKWQQNHPEQFKIIQRNCSKNRRKKIRKKIIELLGGQCVNTYGLHDKPFSDVRCLQIDHLNRKAKHRGQATGGSEMYLRYVLEQIQSGSKDYQLLCANCNWIKRWENKEDGSTKP